MNNSQIIKEVTPEEVDVKPIYREQVTKLTDVIEALSTLTQSNFWKVIENEINSELRKLVSRLEKEEDTREIFILQGQIKGLRKLDLDKMLADKRKELEAVKMKLL